MEQINTLIRIKRPLGNDSAETIVVCAKRRRCEPEASSDSSETNTVLKKLCTIQTQDEPIEDLLKKALQKDTKVSSYHEFKNKFKKAPFDPVINKSRALAKASASENRYKLICSKRHMEGQESLLQDNCQLPKFNIFDAFKEADDASLFSDTITCNGLPVKSEKVSYVYDMYFTSVPIEYHSLVENIFEIESVSNTPMLLYDEDSETESFEDEDDENEEDNWRNDYPDGNSSSEGEYNYDDYLCGHMSKVNLDSEESYDATDD